MKRAFGIWVQNFFAVGDPEWAWRRRCALSAMMLAFFMMIYGTLYEPHFDRFSKLLDIGWMMVSSVMTIYVGGAVVDTINKRNTAAAPLIAAATVPTTISGGLVNSSGPTNVAQQGGVVSPALPPNAVGIGGPGLPPVPRGSTPVGVSA
jgi:hypothetical protein